MVLLAALVEARTAAEEVVALLWMNGISREHERARKTS